MKVCTACLAAFPATADHFYARLRRGAPYLSPECKPCFRARMAKARARDPEKTRQQVRANWHKHKDRYSAAARERNKDPIIKARRAACVRAWLARNHDRTVLQRARHYLENREAIIAANDDYRRRTLPQQRAYRVAYKARKKGAPGAFTADDVARLEAAQDRRCHWCQRPLIGTYHLDHFIPLARGGTNRAENIVLSCATCNTSRKAKMPGEFRRYMRVTGRSAV